MRVVEKIQIYHRRSTSKGNKSHSKRKNIDRRCRVQQALRFGSYDVMYMYQTERVITRKVESDWGQYTNAQMTAAERCRWGGRNKKKSISHCEMSGRQTDQMTATRIAEVAVYLQKSICHARSLVDRPIERLPPGCGRICACLVGTNVVRACERAICRL